MYSWWKGKKRECLNDLLFSFEWSRSLSVMEDHVMVWFGLLITVSAGFWMIKSPVSVPHWRLSQMEQLRLCFVEFGSGIIWAFLSVDAVLPWCLSTSRGRQSLYTCFDCLWASVCTVAVVLDGLMKAQLQREKFSTLVSWVLLWGTIYWDLVLHSLVCWIIALLAVSRVRSCVIFGVCLCSSVS